MTFRTERLQIRVPAREKAALERLAPEAGQDVSAYILARALPAGDGRFAGIVDALRNNDANRRFALAELNDLLSSLAPIELASAVGTIDLEGLSAVAQNYVAAMVEQAARDRGVPAPEWTRDIAPLEEPYFATSLKTLRPYLLRATPVASKRRNIFTDATVGARV